MFDRLVSLDHLILGETMRTPEDICQTVKMLVKSFRCHGYKLEKRLLVMVTTTEDGIGPVYLVLNGYLRIKALLWLREYEYETFREVCPAGQVPIKVVIG